MEHAHQPGHSNGQRVGYASPAEALQAPPEDFVYVAALHTNTGVDEPDFLAVVDVNAGRHGTIEAAKAYLEFLYTPEAQEIAARNFYRPTDPAVAAKHGATFPEIRFFRIDAVAKDWNDAYEKFFGAGGVFDQIYAGGN